MRCPSCGHKDLAPENQKGKFWPYKRQQYQITTDIMVLTCQDKSCREQWIDRSAAEALDHDLEASHQKARRCHWCACTGYLPTGIMCSTCHGTGFIELPNRKT